MNILKIVLALTVLLAAISVWRMAPLFNLDYAADSTASSEMCIAVDAPPGLEDITIDQASGLAYFANDDRRAYLTKGTRASENGALWSLDLNDDTPSLKPITANYPEVFHPHGISLLKEDGKQYLFVVNHPSTTQHQIDVFELSGSNSATLIESITFPELISPNDVHAVSRHRFYITNDHSAPRQTLGEKAEDFLRLAKTNVLFYDNGTVTEVVNDLYMANGVLTNAEQTKLFVAESTGERISMYTRESSEAPEWTLNNHIALDVMPDNLEWSENGKLLVASHPKALDFLLHTFDQSVIAPSVAHAIDVESGSVETIYADDGSILSGSSVAASYDGQVLIGSVFEPKYVHCKAQELASR
ncbi:hypothetical protein A3758_12420 [Oleiphilus sp. HI0118]|uniref:SMP-30/gluconolactonase/LRE family protein n=2 Tax=Oleiphilus TaxID=141450 RepID=UPI0007C28BF3|nr:MULTISPECIES: SMP-30/gluconolactonase/LRE family protein [unclassified Oleiphilus]KZY92551.1 hypothetical protein A3744_02285 [Oleiphilus sp. HI0073]KZZ50506.1 hypothetical protein A3758_12420 [Oleiphilus sp. HI0118]KZZ52816.1 hypothetical protein A3760_09900 [Oleiphilus sp. HI0122]